MTTARDIRDWFDEGVRRGATFLLVCCDHFDYTDYPKYVMPGENPYDKHPDNGEGGMGDSVMECYNLSKPWPEVGRSRVRDYGDWKQPPYEPPWMKQARKAGWTPPPEKK